MGDAQSCCVDDNCTPRGMGRLSELRAFCKKRDEWGLIVECDPKAYMPYKLIFNDGTTDWFLENDVVLESAPFSVSIATPRGTSVKVDNLSPEDTLSKLRSRFLEKYINPEYQFHLEAPLRLGKEMSYPAEDEGFAIHDKLETKIYTSDDLGHKLGKLSLGDGDELRCIPDDFDSTLLRLERTSEPYYDSAGSSATCTLTALFYGERGAADELLVWASQSSKSETKLSADSTELCVVEDASYRYGGQSKLEEICPSGPPLAVSVLIRDARARNQIAQSKLHTTLTVKMDVEKDPEGSWKKKGSWKKTLTMDDQFEMIFGDDEKWASLIGRITRRLSSKDLKGK